MADAALATSSGIRSWAAKSRNHAENVAVRAGPPAAAWRLPIGAVETASAVVVATHGSRPRCWFPLCGPRFFALSQSGRGVVGR